MASSYLHEHMLLENILLICKASDNPTSSVFNSEQKTDLSVFLILLNMFCLVSDQPRLTQEAFWANPIDDSVHSTLDNPGLQRGTDVTLCESSSSTDSFPKSIS